MGALQWVILGCLLLVAIYLLVMPIFRNKRQQQEFDAMSSSLKKGDNVMTYAGITGTIVDIRQLNSMKLVTLSTGTGKDKSFVEMWDKAIYYVMDKDGNPVKAEIPVPAKAQKEEKPTETSEKQVEPTPVKEEHQNAVDKTEKKTKKKTKKD